jgi:hypothetical protein
MKRVGIVQSNYIPWKGYFDLIGSVDEFIVYDDVQYTRRDWRNRNKILTPQGLKWLTVPIAVKQHYSQYIRDIKIFDSDWAISHWRTLYMNYKRSEFFDDIAVWLEPIYMQYNYIFLSDLNFELIKKICEFLGIQTRITKSEWYDRCEGRLDNLVYLCKQAGGSVYVSGPSAKTYLDSSAFESSGIKLSWFNYDSYPEYSQLWGGEFVHQVSVLDLLFNCGKSSSTYMKFPLKHL